MKAKVLMETHNGEKKLNEGDLLFSAQANRDENGLMVNIDWSFGKEVDSTEIKSFLGGMLTDVEEVFGEKMVTEAIMHYADDMGHIVQTPHGPALHLKSKGLEFKNWKKGGK